MATVRLKKFLNIPAFVMVSIARKNLLEDIPRFLAAQAGIMFAVSLVTIQTGIFNGFTRSSTKLINNSTADIWVASDSMIYLDLTLPMPLAHVNLAREVPGVANAEALIATGGVWRHPRENSAWSESLDSTQRGNCLYLTMSSKAIKMLLKNRILL